MEYAQGGVVGYSLGVDLGTTFVAAAICYQSAPEMVTLGARTVVMPSVVYLATDGLLVCGEVAARHAVTDPARAVRGFKRHLGDPIPLRLGDETRQASELVGALLSDVMRRVTDAEKMAPDQVMLTHPANWGPFRRGVFEDAARAAGLSDPPTVTEPAAAAAHYAATRHLPDGHVVAVYDLGGGTFDVTILRASGHEVEMLGVPEGIERLGGIDLDDALYAHLDHKSDGALSTLDVRDPKSMVALARVRQDCVLAKEALSVDSDTVIPVFLPERTFEVVVTRAQFEDLIRAHLESTIGALQRTLRSAYLTPGDIDTVLLVGGSSRIPLVASMVADAIGTPTVVDAHPKYAVALGAAELAAKASRPAPFEGSTAARPIVVTSLADDTANAPAALEPAAGQASAVEPIATEGLPGEAVNRSPAAGEQSQELYAVAEGRRVRVTPTARFIIGRDPGAQLNLANTRVSRRHGILEMVDGTWIYTDISRNGSYLDGRRITQIPINRVTTVCLGGKTDGANLELIPHGAAEVSAAVLPDSRLVSRITRQGQISAVHSLASGRLRIGRLPGNDVVLDDLLVSRHHAELLRTPDGGWQLIDLNSSNGTFVNGHRVGADQPTPIGPAEVIGIGHALLQLDGDRLAECVDAGDNAFEAIGIGVIAASGHALVRPVSFGLPGKALMAVVGPNGAGKSALLSALAGTCATRQGEVHYAERNLYADYDELRYRIATVPRDHAMPMHLSLTEALRHAAELRLPADVTAQDRERLITQVLHETGLERYGDTPIATLSAEQRTRSSVAVELLTKPSLLFLDEPTAELGENEDLAVVQTLRALSDHDRTIIVATRNVANLEIFDRLLFLAKGGWPVYFGSPAEALAHFGERTHADIMLRLDESSGQQLAEKFQSSPRYRRYADRTGEHRAAPSHPVHLPPITPRRQIPLAQIGLLSERHLCALAADRQYLTFATTLPLALTLLARAVPGGTGLSIAAALTNRESPPNLLLVVLTVGAALIGGATAVQELVKDGGAYLRERADGVSVGAYLASKILVLAGITTLQISLFALLSLLGRRAPDDPLVLAGGELEIFVALLGAGLVSMLGGLAVSAIIDRADQGIRTLLLTIAIQVACCGGLFPVYGRPVLEQMSWLTPSHWAFSMTAATIDLTRLTSSNLGSDPLWEHTSGAWLGSGSVLVGMAILLTTITARLLKRRH